MLSIEQIRPELTWRLRQQVLYPNSKLYEMEMDEDNHGYHFGAFQDNELVAVVSLFQDSTDFQFRKFAVINRLQKTGVGKTLLNYITGFAIAEGAKRIWCNARVSAVGFYLRYDFAQTGKVYSKGGIDYEIMEKDLKTEN